MGMRSVLVVVALLAAAAESTLAQDEEKAATVTNFEGFGELTNVISTDKTKANLSCESGDMVVKLQFSESFRGVIYADRDRNSPCKTYGDGSSYYVFQIPLQGCGTKERVTSEYRMFVNDIVVRFHPSLELEGDEVKTILCRYPPPVAPLPPILLPPLPAEVPAMVAAKPRNLSEVELMLIICAVFFLGLLLLGVGLAYYCLKKRNIKIVKRRAVSTTGPPSEITKLSGSTLGPLSIPIGDIRIPRATAHSTSGSEAALLTSASGGEQSDTITSDYPSESPSSLHSDVEEVETRSLHVTTSQEASYENRAYLHEEEYMRQQQQMMMMSMTPPQPPAQEELRERLTTIHEHEDVMRQEEFQQVHALVTQQREYIPPAPRYAAEPPVYARIRKRQIEQLRDEMRSVSEATEDFTHVAYAPSTTVTGSIIEGSIPDNDHASMSEFSEVAATRKAPPQPPPQRVQLATEMQESRSISEYAESVSVQYAPPAVTPNYSHTEGRSGRTLSQVAEPPPLMATETALVPTKAAPTRHLIDDRYLTTFTETRTSEDVTKTTRDILETHMKEVPQPKWDVMIRTYPPNEPTENIDAASEVETWEKYSVVSERPRMIFDTSEETLTTMEVQASEPPVEVNRHPTPNWDVLIRVLQPAPPPSVHADTASDITDVRSVLSEDDREKWRAIITTDSTLRTLLTEAKTVEDFQVIRRDERYERLFEQPKWDVIIRILADPHDTNYDSPDTASMSDTASYTSERPAMRYNARRRSEYDTRSRRSSLPPLYEADSPDGAAHLSHPPPPRSRRTSSHRSEFDVRSLTESEVNFARSDRDSMYSGDTETDGIQLRGTGGPHFHRPSLMRSTSEVMQGLETIERDSLDEQESVGPYRGGQRPLYHRYSPEQSPTTERRHHRLLERSSTEILVDSHQRRSTTDIHMMEERKDQWID